MSQYFFFFNFRYCIFLVLKDVLFASFYSFHFSADNTTHLFIASILPLPQGAQLQCLFQNLSENFNI